VFDVFMTPSAGIHSQCILFMCKQRAQPLGKLREVANGLAVKRGDEPAAPPDLTSGQRAVQAGIGRAVIGLSEVGHSAQARSLCCK